jgi:hypothetical protein
MASIIFLDVDGPMIPVKAYYLPNQSKPARMFDPCAVGMLNDLLKNTNSRIVMSSIHRLHGLQYIKDLLTKNGIDPKFLHTDWTTPQIVTTRSGEIQLWLDDHNVEHYIAIDDETLDESLVSTKCCGYEGFSMINFLECKLALGYADLNSGVPKEEQRNRIETTLQFLKA